MGTGIMGEWYGYKSGGDTFPGVERRAMADVDFLVWLHEAEAGGPEGARPRKVRPPLARVTIYKTVAGRWTARIGDGGSRDWAVHGIETVEAIPARIAAAHAALAAMSTAKGTVAWDCARELIACEAARALGALWYASRNVRGSRPLGAPDVREVLAGISVPGHGGEADGSEVSSGETPGPGTAEGERGEAG